MFDIEDEDERELERRAEALVRNHRRLLEKLIGMRSAHRLTQADVAAEMGVSQPTVAAFERYDSNPTLSTIRRYALAVHARLDDDVTDDCNAVVPADWAVAELHAGRSTWSTTGRSEKPARWITVGAGSRETTRHG